MRFTSAPLAMQWPWPRCVLVTRSAFVSVAHTPTATASWPDVGMHRAVDLPAVRSLIAQLVELADQDHRAQHLEELRGVGRHAGDDLLGSRA